MASSFLRNLSRKLSSLPGGTLDKAWNVASLAKGSKADKFFHGRLPTSLDRISPGNPALLAVADIPVAPPIKAHSIVPVKGDGDYREGRDGVVACQSAPVDYAESELVVRGGHSCQNLPATIEQVHRILHEHLKDLDAEP